MLHHLIFTLILLFSLYFHTSSAAPIKYLDGVKLKGCVLLEDPYIIENPDEPYGFEGIAIEYLTKLREYLGFTIDLEKWDSSWSDFIDHMANCKPQNSSSNSSKPSCRCDIGVGSFTMTNQRAEIIKFVWPFSNEAHHMIARKSSLRVDGSQDRWFVFKTFSFSVWMIIFFGILLHAFGTIFFGPFRPTTKHIHRELGSGDRSRRTDKRTLSRARARWQLKRFPAAVLYAYSHLIGHPVGPEPGTPSIHRAAWNVLGLTAGIFLLAIYEASLTVLLFESTKESPFKSIRDITDCALSPKKIAMIEGGASQAFWNNAINNTYIRGKCDLGQSVGIPVNNIRHGFQMVKSGEADYFYSLEGSVTITANRNCSDVVPVGEPFFFTSVGFVMPHDANESLLGNLSRTTRILRERDVYTTASTKAAQTSCDAIVDATITAPKLGIFFVMYVVIWAVLVVYRWIFLCKRRRAARRAEIDVTTNMELASSMDITAMDLAVPDRVIQDPDSGSNSYSWLKGYPYAYPEGTR